MSILFLISSGASFVIFDSFMAAFSLFTFSLFAFSPFPPRFLLFLSPCKENFRIWASSCSFVSFVHYFLLFFSFMGNFIVVFFNTSGVHITHKHKYMYISIYYQSCILNFFSFYIYLLGGYRNWHFGFGISNKPLSLHNVSYCEVFHVILFYIYIYI